MCYNISNLKQFVCTGNTAKWQRSRQVCPFIALTIRKHLLNYCMKCARKLSQLICVLERIDGKYE